MAASSKSSWGSRAEPMDAPVQVDPVAPDNETVFAPQTVIVLPAGLNDTSLGNEDPLVKEICEWIVSTGEEHAKEGKLSEGAYEAGCKLSKHKFNSISPRKFAQAMEVLGCAVLRAQQVTDDLDATEKKCEELRGKYAKLQGDHAKLQDVHIALQRDNLREQKTHKDLLEKHIALQTDYLDERKKNKGSLVEAEAAKVAEQEAPLAKRPKVETKIVTYGEETDSVL